MFAIKYKDGSFLSETGRTNRHTRIKWIKYWMVAQTVKGDGEVVSCHDLFQAVAKKCESFLGYNKQNDNAKNWNSH